MKKTFLALLLAIILCVTCSGCGLDFAKGYGNSEKFNSGNAEISQTVENIKINWSSGAVNIKYHSGTSIKIPEKASEELSAENTMQWLLDGTTLNIEFVKSGKLISVLSKELTLLIPQNFIAGDMELKLSSSKLETESLQVKNLSIDSSSSEINLKQAGTTDKIKIDSSSGKITAQTETVRELEAESSSGEVNITAGEVGNAEIETSSGNVGVKIEKSFSFCEIETASGGVTLNVPTDNGFTGEIETASGEFKSLLPLVRNGEKYTYGNGSAKLKIETASGDISVN